MDLSEAERDEELVGWACEFEEGSDMEGRGSQTDEVHPDAEVYHSLLSEER